MHTFPIYRNGLQASAWRNDPSVKAGAIAALDRYHSEQRLVPTWGGLRANGVFVGCAMSAMIDGVGVNPATGGAAAAWTALGLHPDFQSYVITVFDRLCMLADVDTAWAAVRRMFDALHVGADTRAIAYAILTQHSSSSAIAYRLNSPLRDATLAAIVSIIAEAPVPVEATQPTVSLPNEAALMWLDLDVSLLAAPSLKPTVERELVAA